MPGLDLVPTDSSSLDITDREAVFEQIEVAEPELVIHAAAYTAVDDCESNAAHAMKVNGGGTQNVVDAAHRVGARVLYISTDYVFDGTKPTPYVETDEPNPASVYGQTKLEGERAVGEHDLIVRTSWVCGAHGANMVKTILRLAGSVDTLTFVDDQIGKPTFTSDLAGAVLALAQRDDAGIFHVTNEGVVSWYEFCREVLLAAGHDTERVRPCATEDLQPPRPAPRPANSVLENTRFAPMGMELLRDYRLPLREVVADLTR